TALTSVFSFPSLIRAVQPLICGSGELRSEPLHSSIFFILLMSFELCGADHASADRLSKNNTAAPTITNRSGRSGEICVGIAHTKKSFARGVGSATFADLKVGLAL